MECIAYWASSGAEWQRMFDWGHGSQDDNLLFCRYGNTSQLFFGVFNGSGSESIVSNSGAIQFGQYALYTAVSGI
jgi:hypothetical protein